MRLRTALMAAVVATLPIAGATEVASAHINGIPSGLGAAMATTAVTGDAPDAAVEQAVQNALPEGQFYASAGGSLFVPSSVTAKVGVLSEVTTSDGLPTEPGATVGDMGFPEVDIDAPVSPDAQEDVTEPPGSEEPSAALASGTPPWRPCGISDSKHKMVRDYSRQAMSGFSGRSAHLKCGTAENWSYRHIKARHMADWQGKASMVGAQWMDFTHWAFVQTLSHPCTKTHRASNDTLQYVTPIQIKDRDGHVVHEFGSRVSLARASQNIITAYPQRSRC